MKAVLRRSTLACAVLGAFAFGQAHAAIQLSEDLDGVWSVDGASGRGAVVDYLPQADGKGILAIGYYAYDAQGKATWVLTTAPFSEFQYQAENADINLSSGGNFGAPFVAPTATTKVGSAKFDVKSCDAITLTLDMTDASGLADATLNLKPFFASEQCAYKRTFTACPSFATAAPTYGDRACQISGEKLGTEINLTNETTWVVEGQLAIGGDNANPSTLRIEPGTLIVSTGDTFDHIAIRRGSKVFAQGALNYPIVLTSPSELPGFSGNPQAKEVGGFVIAGNAPSNCNPNCVAEWDPNLKYGGTLANESSGVVSHMQVRYAGYVFAANRELNSFTFAGVGAGTTLDHLQSYKGGDDGVEFFGGTANLRHFVDSCGGDDSIDWDEGYTGKIQFALLNQRGCSGEDHGFELANSPTNFDATPRAKGTVANFTAIGGGANSASSRDGFNLKEGTGGNFFNGVVSGFKRSCVRIEGTATTAAAGPANAPNGTLTMQNTVVNCATNFNVGTGVDAAYAQAWFTGQSGNVATDAKLVGFLPTAESPIFGKAFAPANDWFVQTDYAGAFRSAASKDNWTLGWTHRVND
ncbi:MAG: hypothetical protein LKM39_15190 [Chiayiivirga sp.]|jgi:hypothetical protein|nr:hypothetical protein [Chiayiivirga sp.]